MEFTFALTLTLLFIAVLEYLLLRQTALILRNLNCNFSKQFKIKDSLIIYQLPTFVIFYQPTLLYFYIFTLRSFILSTSFYSTYLSFCILTFDICLIFSSTFSPFYILPFRSKLGVSNGITVFETNWYPSNTLDNKFAASSRNDSTALRKKLTSYKRRKKRLSRCNHSRTPTTVFETRETPSKTFSKLRKNPYEAFFGNVSGHLHCLFEPWKSFLL